MSLVHIFQFLNFLKRGITHKILLLLTNLLFMTHSRPSSILLNNSSRLVYVCIHAHIYHVYHPYSLAIQPSTLPLNSFTYRPYRLNLNSTEDDDGRYDGTYVRTKKEIKKKRRRGILQPQHSNLTYPKTLTLTTTKYLLCS